MDMKQEIILSDFLTWQYVGQKLILQQYGAVNS